MSSFERRVGENTLTIETGRLAQQANGAVVVRYGDSMVLVTATMSTPRPGIDFFPLTIDFEERLYARGRIPGGFPRREGRPTTDSVLTMRLTDRPLRPLFPKDFRNEVQIITTPLSADLENPLDMISIIGASAALSISDIPFNGPIGATRIGYVDGEYVVNPTYQQTEESDLDLVVAGSRDGVLMMEAGANEVSDDMVLEAIEMAQDVNLELIAMQDEAVAAHAKPKSGYAPFGYDKALEPIVEQAVGGKLSEAMSPEGDKADRSARIAAVKDAVVAEVGDQYDAKDVAEAFGSFVEKEFRRRIIENGERPDGRGAEEIRALTCETGISPRAHGTGLFQRGETQVLAFTTLGSVGDKQKIDNLTPTELRRFMLHYNFPPYSARARRAKRVGSPGRQGDRARRAGGEAPIAAVLPSEEEFPYTLRVVVCECIQLQWQHVDGQRVRGVLWPSWTPGVPIKTPVAGISRSASSPATDDRYVTLTDIQGLEDHCRRHGLQGRRVEADGITAIQLDIKVKSISRRGCESTRWSKREDGQALPAGRRWREALAGNARRDESVRSQRMTSA